MAANSRRLDQLIRRTCSVLGCPIEPVEVVGERKMMAKLLSILESDSHSLKHTLSELRSSFSERLIHPQCVKESYHRSFLTAAVKVHNQH